MYIWLNTILQGGVLTPETPPLRTPMVIIENITHKTKVTPNDKNEDFKAKTLSLLSVDLKSLLALSINTVQSNH